MLGLKPAVIGGDNDANAAQLEHEKEAGGFKHELGVSTILGRVDLQMFLSEDADRK